MIRITATYARGKDFERDHVTKVIYADENDNEISVENEEILSHRFPVKSDFVVYAEDGMSNVSGQGLRAISAYDVDDEL